VWKSRDQKVIFALWNRYYIGDNMEVTILSKKENEINMKIAGETHTLMNLLKTTLLNNEHVEIATYDIEHPTISDPVLFVRTDGADPVEVIKKAIRDIIKQCDEFIELFTKKAKN